MSSDRLSITSFSKVISVFIFSFSAQINFHMLPSLLSRKGFSESSLDSLELSGFFCQMVASILLVPLILTQSSKRPPTLILALLLINLFNILMVSQLNLLKVHMLIISVCSFLYPAFLFITFLSSIDKKLVNLALFCIIWSAGYLCGNSTVAIFLRQTTPEYAIIFTGFLFALLALYHYLGRSFTRDDPNTDIKFSAILPAIELEAACAFSVAYIFSSTYWWYEIIALMKNFAVRGTDELLSYMVVSLVVCLMPLVTITSRYRKNILTLACYIVLLISYLSLPRFATSILANLMFIMLIVGSMSCIFICNILSINAKFSQTNFKVAVALYLIAATLGAYSGPVATDAALDTLGEKGFIISITLTVILFLAYYGWYFKKNRLYEW